MLFRSPRPPQRPGSVPTGGRKGSIVAGRYSAGLWQHPEGEPEPEKYASNEEVAKAVQQKVAAAVETSRKYRHVAWYSLFVAVYMIVLYLQARARAAAAAPARRPASLLQSRSRASARRPRALLSSLPPPPS